MGNMHLVTGYAGRDHVTAADHGSFYAALIGSGTYILDKGNKFGISKISENLVRVSDGDMLMQGRHIRVADGAFVELAVEGGTNGYKRKDLVCVRYSQNGDTGVEDCSLVVLRGNPVAADPVDPEYVTGDIIGGALQHEFPMYRLNLNGTTLESIECLCEENLLSFTGLIAQIAESIVSESKLANGAVSTNKLADGAVTNTKLANTSVNTDKLAALAVTAAKLAALAVTTEKIADSAVTTAKLGSSAVTNAKIANSTIDAAKLAFSPAMYTVGSYRGDGESGWGEQNSLTFPFVPKMVLIVDETYGAKNYGSVCWMGQNFGASQVQFSLSNKTLSWYTSYDDSPEYQMNEFGDTYTYIAIG